MLYLSPDETTWHRLLKSKYKAISNLVRSQTRKDTASYVSDISTHYFMNSKKFWNFLNSVKVCRHPIPPLKQKLMMLKVLMTLHAKATIFNKYFHSVFTIEDCNNISNLHQSLEYHPDLVDSIDFSVEKVYSELLNLR